MAEYVPSIKRIDQTSAVAAADLKHAQKLLKEKNFDQAVIEFDAFLKLDPLSYNAQMGAGIVKFRLKRYEDALVHFKEVIRLEPLKVRGYMLAARTAGAQKDLEKATEYLQNVIKIDPRQSPAYAGIGQSYLKQEKYAEAAEQFKLSLRYNPRFTKAHQGLATAYVRLGKLTEAIAQLKIVLTIDPNNAATYNGLGRIYLDQKEYELSREAYERAMSLSSEPSLSTSLGLAEGLIAQNRLQGAAEILSSLSEREKFKPKVHALWGDLYLRQGKFKESAQEYQAASLLTAEGGVPDDDILGFDLLEGMDDSQLEEIATEYRSKASKAMRRRPLSAGAE